MLRSQRKAPPAPKPSVEEYLLSSVPAEWAGPLMVMLVSFMVFAGMWLALAKRPTSQRIAKEKKLHRAVDDPYSFYDPSSGQSHRFFKAELATRIVSTIHAALVCYGAAMGLYTHRNMFQDMLWATSPIVRFWYSVSLAYFLGDILLCVVMFREYGFMFTFHGICAFAAVAIICLGNMFHFFGCIGFLWEFSTIFLNLRWFMLEYGFKETLAFKLNGIALVFFFFIFRIFIGCPYSFIFWTQLSSARAEGKISGGVYLTMSLMLGGVNSLNIFWGKKLMHGLIRLFRKWGLPEAIKEP